MRKMFVITCSLVFCCGLLTSKSLAREEIGEIVRSVAGTEDSTGDRAKKLVKWMNIEYLGSLDKTVK